MAGEFASIFIGSVINKDGYLQGALLYVQSPGYRHELKGMTQCKPRSHCGRGPLLLSERRVKVQIGLVACSPQGPCLPMLGGGGGLTLPAGPRKALKAKLTPGPSSAARGEPQWDLERGRQRLRAVFEREDIRASVEGRWSLHAQLRGGYCRASEGWRGLQPRGPGPGQQEAFEGG